MVAFNHTALQARHFQKRLQQVFRDVLHSGIFLEGPENQKLTKKLQRFFRRPYVTLVNSGHDALLLALQSLHLSPTDEVIFPANAYPTVPVFMANVKPVLVDCDENGQVNLEQLADAITVNTKAVIVVHLYGGTTQLDQLQKILRGKKITLIEDCAQSFGTRYRRKLTGTWGDIACFSFYPTKNLGTLGDGGAVITKHKKHHDFFQRAKKYGENQKYASQFLSDHSRLPEVQASCLNIYLAEFSQVGKKRAQVYRWYMQALTKLGLEDVRVLSRHPQTQPVQHLFVIEVDQRDQLRRFLARHQIETHILHPLPISQVKTFQETFSGEKIFIQAEYLASHILCLPFHQYLTKPEVKWVVTTIQKFYEKTR